MLVNQKKEVTRELFRAIEAGGEADCWAAVRDGAELNAVSSDGYSVIQKASQCVKARKTIVDFLIGCGADVNLLGDRKDSAVALAIARDERNICHLLVEHGANIELRVSDLFYTALGSAAYNGRPELFKYIAEAGGDLHAPHRVAGDVLNPLQLAARAGELEIVRYCLEDLGMDPNCKTERGRSLIQLASKSLEIKDLVRSQKAVVVVQDGVGSDEASDMPRKARDGISL
jgi:ankyrin repeat protein